eukprot:Rmarinus@m.25393
MSRTHLLILLTSLFVSSCVSGDDVFTVGISFDFSNEQSAAGYAGFVALTKLAPWIAITAYDSSGDEATQLEQVGVLTDNDGVGVVLVEDFTSTRLFDELEDLGLLVFYPSDEDEVFEDYDNLFGTEISASLYPTYFIESLGNMGAKYFVIIESDLADAGTQDASRAALMRALTLNMHVAKYDIESSNTQAELVSALSLALANPVDMLFFALPPGSTDSILAVLSSFGIANCHSSYDLYGIFITHYEPATAPSECIWFPMPYEDNPAVPDRFFGTFGAVDEKFWGWEDATAPPFEKDEINLRRFRSGANLAVVLADAVNGTASGSPSELEELLLSPTFTTDTFQGHTIFDPETQRNVGHEPVVYQVQGGIPFIVYPPGLAEVDFKKYEDPVDESEDGSSSHTPVVIALSFCSLVGLMLCCWSKECVQLRSNLRNLYYRRPQPKWEGELACIVRTQSDSDAKEGGAAHVPSGPRTSAAKSTAGSVAGALPSFSDRFASKAPSHGTWKPHRGGSLDTLLANKRLRWQMELLKEAGSGDDSGLLDLPHLRQGQGINRSGSGEVKRSRSDFTWANVRVDMGVSKTAGAKDGPLGTIADPGDTGDDADEEVGEPHPGVAVVPCESSAALVSSENTSVSAGSCLMETQVDADPEDGNKSLGPNEADVNEGSPAIFPPSPTQKSIDPSEPDDRPSPATNQATITHTEDDAKSARTGDDRGADEHDATALSGALNKAAERKVVSSRRRVARSSGGDSDDMDHHHPTRRRRQRHRPYPSGKRQRMGTSSEDTSDPDGAGPFRTGAAIGWSPVHDMGMHSSAPENSVWEGLTMNSFDLAELIGQGTFGQIWRARLRSTGEVFALKVFNKIRMVQMSSSDRVKSERDILAGIHDCAISFGLQRYPFIVKMHADFRTSEFVAFVLEYVEGGDFWQFISEQPEGRLPEDVAVFYAAELLLALDYIHTQGIVYRDVKPENILLGGDGHLILADFGLAKCSRGSPDSPDDFYQYGLASAQSSNGCHSLVGTWPYMAPEVLERSGYDCGVDWWAFGIFVFQMICGLNSHPFIAFGEERQSIKNILEEPPNFPSNCSITAAAMDFISRLLEKDPKQRLGTHGMEEIVDHEFFAGVDWGALLHKRVQPPLLPQQLIRSVHPIYEPSSGWQGYIPPYGPPPLLHPPATLDHIHSNSSSVPSRSGPTHPANFPRGYSSQPPQTLRSHSDFGSASAVQAPDPSAVREHSPARPMSPRVPQKAGGDRGRRPSPYRARSSPDSERLTRSLSSSHAPGCGTPQSPRRLKPVSVEPASQQAGVSTSPSLNKSSNASMDDGPYSTLVQDLNPPFPAPALASSPTEEHPDQPPQPLSTIGSSSVPGRVYVGGGELVSAERPTFLFGQPHPAATVPVPVPAAYPGQEPHLGVLNAAGPAVRSLPGPSEPQDGSWRQHLCPPNAQHPPTPVPPHPHPQQQQQQNSRIQEYATVSPASWWGA